MGHEGLVLYICGLVVVTLQPTERFFLIVLDLIIVNILNIILALAVSSKADTLFELKEDGYTMNKVVNDYDQYLIPALGGEAGLDNKEKGLESRDNLREGEEDDDEELTFSVSDRNDE